MSEERMYETLFVNKAVQPWVIKERNGTTIAVVLPDSKLKLVSYKPHTFWSRYVSATRNKDLSIDVKVNKKWQPPWQSDYFIEFANYDTVDHSIGLVAPNPCGTPSGYVRIPAGMPSVLVPVTIYDPLVKFKKVVWRPGQVEQPIKGTRYFTYRAEVVHDDELRSADEIERIIQMRAELARAAALKQADEQMERVKRQLQADASIEESYEGDSA